MSIVFLDGKQGVIDGLGHLLLEPVWDCLDFLSDDCLLLERSGLSYLADREGRLFAESADRRELEDNFQRLYDEHRISDVLYWDEVMDDLDSLCNSCLGIEKGKKVSEIRVIEAFETLKGRLAQPSGKPDSSQLARLEGIVERFERHRR